MIDNSWSTHCRINSVQIAAILVEPDRNAAMPVSQLVAQTHFVYVVRCLECNREATSTQMLERTEKGVMVERLRFIDCEWAGRYVGQVKRWAHARATEQCALIDGLYTARRKVD
ncbi:hypothetical protein [Burkholderia aenigmatica]|uniref:hypothetical protein n=1 Tax=Burkholderia aenigmatica TaxID=2015348 RepID=UPI0026565AA1|nr:hypothetical protein [Burkholderia aenigmatica]MDN7880052.1 hypothetical protein [Burkholderia aenigmatica]